MSEITICPFRTYTDVRPTILKGQGDFTLMGFMDCLKGKCPAFFVENGEERCKILALPERETGNVHQYNYCPNCGAKMEVEG